MLGLFLVLDDFTKNILQCLGVGKNSYDFKYIKDCNANKYGFVS